MNLNQLKAFFVVVKTGAFSRAAERLFVTEPAVFIQVRSLERYLGFKLIDRFGKDLQTTEVGLTLFRYAEKIFGLVEEADKAINELQALESGELRVGSAKALAQYLMPSVVGSFQNIYPKVRVVLSEGNSEELVRGVLNREFELAIVARMPYTDRVSAIPFSKEKIIAVVSPDNEVLEGGEITLDELNEQPAICREEGSATRLATRIAFEKQGLNPSAVIESANTEFIKNMVKQDKGFSFLSLISIRNEINAGHLVAVPLKETDISIDIDIIHLKGKTLSPSAVTFLNFLRESRDSEDLCRTADRIGERGGSVLPITANATSKQDRKRLRLVEGQGIPRAVDL